MNLERAWGRAQSKRLKLTGLELAEHFDELVDCGPTRRPEMRGVAHVIDGRRPVRELNGAPLMDQQVRWWPTAPGIDRPDRPPPRQPQYVWPDFKPRWTKYEVDVDRGRDDRTAAAAYGFARGQGGQVSNSYKNVLKVAIAAQPKGTPERARLEQLLRKIEEGG